MDSVVNQCYFAIQCVFNRTRKIQTKYFSINWCRLRLQNYLWSRRYWRTIFKRKKLIMKGRNRVRAQPKNCSITSTNRNFGSLLFGFAMNPSPIPASNLAVIRYVSPQLKFLPLQYFHVTYSIFETKYIFCLSLLWNFFTNFHSEYLHITFNILYVRKP